MKHMLTLILFAALSVPAFAQNFTGPDVYVKRAEQAREDIARFWTGKPLPMWYEPCPITAKVKPNTRYVTSGGGGATTFSLDLGQVFDWHMTIEGPHERLMDSVIPHEVDHAVRYSLARHRIARWLDEGVASLFECASEHERLRKDARRFANSRFSAWSLFDGGEYPQTSDGLQAFYGTGFSVAEWLLVTQGRERLLAFIMDKRKPSQKFHEHFGMSVREARARWSEWISQRPSKCSDAGCYFHGTKVVSEKVVTRSLPKFYVISATWCAACRPFAWDYGHDAEFRAWLQARFTVVPVDFDNYSDWARSKGVKSIPAFVYGDQVLTGYRNQKTFMGRVANLSQPQQTKTLPKAQAKPLKITACGCKECFTRVNARISQLEARIQSISVQRGERGPQGPQGERGPQGEPGPPGDSVDVTQGLKRLKELEAQLNAMSGGFTFRIIDVNGNVATQRVKAGDTLTIRQAPVRVKGAE